MNIWKIVENTDINSELVAEYLLNQSSEIWQSINRHNETPFHIAIRNFQQPAILQSMLEHGAHLAWKMKDKTGLTPLHNAMIYQQDPEVFKLFFTHGAACSWTDNQFLYFFDHTPLYYAILYQTNPENFKIFFENGAEEAWNIPNYKGNTVLHEIITDLKYDRIRFEVLERVMKYIPPEIFIHRNDEGATPLDRLTITLRRQIIDTYNNNYKSIFKYIAYNYDPALTLTPTFTHDTTTIYDLPAEVLNIIFQKTKIKEPVSHVKVSLINSYQDRWLTTGASMSSHIHNA